MRGVQHSESEAHRWWDEAELLHKHLARERELRVAGRSRMSDGGRAREASDATGFSYTDRDGTRVFPEKEMNSMVRRVLLSDAKRRGLAYF